MLVLVAVGLIAASSATYKLLDSSLIDRVDEQLDEAGLPTARALLFLGDRAGRRQRFGAPFGPGGGFMPPGRRGHLITTPGFPITFFALVGPEGNVTSSQAFGIGALESAPRLPAGLPGSASQADHFARRYFTTLAGNDSDLRFRVLASALGPREGTVVVALALTEVDATLHRLLFVEALVGASVLAAVGALAGWLVRVGLRPLTEMEQTAAAIAAGDLSRRVEPAEPRTEVGRLGLALNNMLERIEAAFAERSASEERLRRFVADASHELRTPLTSIRGYAELFRRGARTRPEDLAKSMNRIEEEAARMGKLVEELLLLAKFDQRPVLDKEPVDLSRLVFDAAEDARATQPERRIETEVNQPAVVDGDETRLRQVLANLLANALEHTPAGTPIKVRVSSGPEEAVLEVADTGPGLEERHADKVFDRFFRVDKARARDRGGAGLGLSIVDSIVTAHGGRVWVDTSPGRGAAFKVALPASKATPPELEKAADPGSA